MNRCFTSRFPYFVGYYEIKESFTFQYQFDIFSHFQQLNLCFCKSDANHLLRNKAEEKLRRKFCKVLTILCLTNEFDKHYGRQYNK